MSLEEKPPTPSDPRLAHLLGALLCDLAKAQDLSNQYSLALAKKYKEDPLLSVFPVPNGLLEDVSLDLLLDSEGVASSALAPAELGDFLDQALSAPVEEVIADFRRSLGEVLARYASSSPRLPALLEGIQQPAWSAYIRPRIREGLQAIALGAAELSEEGEGLAPLARSLHAMVLGHPEIQKLELAATFGEELLRMLQGEGSRWSRLLADHLRQVCQRVSVPGLLARPLSGQTPGGLTLRVKAGMRTFSWILQGKSEGSDKVSTRGVLTLDQGR